MPPVDLRTITSDFKVVLAEPADGSPVMLPAAEVIKAGMLVAINASGQAINWVSGPVVGFSLKNAPVGGMCTVIEWGIVEKVAGTALNLTTGANVFAATGGNYAATGTAIVGIALTPSKVRVRM